MTLPPLTFDDLTLILFLAESWNLTLLGTYNYTLRGETSIQGAYKDINSTITVKCIRGCNTALIVTDTIFSNK